MSDLENYANFWTHGVDTIIEYPERAQRIQHAGWGTLVEQYSGDGDNWFHFPLHSPTQVTAYASSSSRREYVSRTALLGGARFKARLNNNARIIELHVRAGEQIVRANLVNIPGARDVDEWIDVRTPDGLSHRLYLVEQVGLVLCVRVEFSGIDSVGQVIFFGAGAYYLNTI
ncbi:MAG: hypothetical protein L0Y73_01570 [Candidatus Aminicenantes bacterium]|nr:hypothetical protein [Candidatus Aminicenantes bacterium]